MIITLFMIHIFHVNWILTTGSEGWDLKQQISRAFTILPICSSLLEETRQYLEVIFDATDNLSSHFRPSPHLYTFLSWVCAIEIEYWALCQCCNKMLLFDSRSYVILSPCPEELHNQTPDLDSFDPLYFLSFLQMTVTKVDRTQYLLNPYFIDPLH